MLQAAGRYYAHEERWRWDKNYD